MKKNIISICCEINHPFNFLRRYSGLIVHVFFLLCIILAYSCASLNSNSYNLRVKAIKRTNDQEILYKFALNDQSPLVRQIAFERLTDQNLLFKMNEETNEYAVQEAVVAKLTDQNLLARVVVGVNAYKLKKYALSRLTDQGQLAKVAMESTDLGLQREALSRLTDQNSIAKVAMVSTDLEMQKEVFSKLTDQEALTKIANEATDLRIQIFAVAKLTNQKELLHFVQDSNGWYVRRAAFNRLDKTSLAIILKEEKDSSVILAAKILLGELSWKEVLGNTSQSNTTLGYAIGAAAFVDNPQPTSEDVVSACHSYIRYGDTTRIPALRNLLLRYGNQTLAEDYLNCGNQDLESAAYEWGRLYGYTIQSGNGSNRVQWGSDKK